MFEFYVIVNEKNEYLSMFQDPEDGYMEIYWNKNFVNADMFDLDWDFTNLENHWLKDYDFTKVKMRAEPC